jgi:chromosomal replication initiator protein
VDLGEAERRGVMSILNTKIAMMLSWAEAENIPIPWPVAYYVATAAPEATQRELEGLMVRLYAYASLTGETITPSFAREVLEKIITPTAH